MIFGAAIRAVFEKKQPHISIKYGMITSQLSHKAERWATDLLYGSIPEATISLK